jgi:hypothetical protein
VGDLGARACYHPRQDVRIQIWIDSYRSEEVDGCKWPRQGQDSVAILTVGSACQGLAIACSGRAAEAAAVAAVAAGAWAGGGCSGFCDNCWTCGGEGKGFRRDSFYFYRGLTYRTRMG